jgi:hypothetical protein
MAMRIPRMTAQRWIAVPAGLVVLLGGLILARRSDHFRERSAFYAEAERSCTEGAVALEKQKELAEGPDRPLDLVFSLGTTTNRGRSERLAHDAARLRGEAEECARLKRAFLHAANYPWESGPPEPVRSWQE